MDVDSTAVLRAGNPNLRAVITEKHVAQKLKYRMVTNGEEGLMLTQLPAYHSPVHERS